MTRPNIIRADTIDLQNQDAPSAKDHTRQPTHPRALGEGPPAPHQADALKHVEMEVSEQHGRSPRHSQDLSGKELGLLHHEDGDYNANDAMNQDAGTLLRNGGVNGSRTAEEDVGEGDGDESDDDLMDKISSSPSIGDDGGYHLPLSWPHRGNSLPSPDSPVNLLSSSPYSETPSHFPLSFPRNEPDQTPSKVHHQKGKPVLDLQKHFPSKEDLNPENHDGSNSLADKQPDVQVEDIHNTEDSYDADYDPDDFHRLLLPADDPLLDNNFDDMPLSLTSSDNSSTTSKTSLDQEPEEDDDNDDDTEDIFLNNDSRRIDSGWGGECLRETEDIDFEFVYALHTFVATVEGQANAAKGDNMVLLDDSNSYWWLVRVMKDNSIGYLPAEHIETPLERLARLNKHRNLDLSQTMLGDEEEKRTGNSLNPLKKAMRRRNTKTVQFTAPSYVEPSDIEYSSEEEEEGNDEFGTHEQNGSAAQDTDQGKVEGETAATEPLKARGLARDARSNGNSNEHVNDQTLRDGGLGPKIAIENDRTSDEISDRAEDGATGKSRNGTLRNTDSFFRDDGVETRKINLTPSLLREEAKGHGMEPRDGKELKTRTSLESLERDAPPDKGDKKRKEKRGVLGSMFKRKDKKSKGQEKELEDEKASNVSSRSPPTQDSVESLSQEAAKLSQQSPRQIGKLQKTPPPKSSPKPSYTQREPVTRNQPSSLRSTTAEETDTDASTLAPESVRGSSVASHLSGSTLMVQPESDTVTENTIPALNFNPPAQNHEEISASGTLSDNRRGIVSPIKDVVETSPLDSKPEEARQAATQQIHRDDFDTSSDEEQPTEPSSERESHEEPNSYAQHDSQNHLAIAQEAQHDDPEPQVHPAHHEPSSEPLSDSPIDITPPQDYPHSAQPPLNYQETIHQPPPLMVDTSSQEDRSASPASSPELVEAPQSADRETREKTPASTAQSSTPTWSDASLRAYMDNDSEIRDLLVVVHDKSNIKPARRDHPIVKNMYREENRKLGELSNQLDGLLASYLARKGRTPTPVR